jgi:hypothetical protein
MHAFDKIMEQLDEITFDGSVPLARRISMDLALLALNQLDDQQLSLLKFAASELDGKQSVHQWETALNRAWTLDAEVQQCGSKSEKSIARLVTGALVKTTGMSFVLADFLVGLSEDAGINPNDVCIVFETHLVGFEASKIR